MINAINNYSVTQFKNVSAKHNDQNANVNFTSAFGNLTSEIAQKRAAAKEIYPMAFATSVFLGVLSASGLGSYFGGILGKFSAFTQDCIMVPSLLCGVGTFIAGCIGLKNWVKAH